MIDLVALTADFIKNHLSLSDEEINEDKAVAHAVATPSLDLDTRNKLLATWLYHYSVLRVPDLTGAAVAGTILRFADNGHSDAATLNPEAIKSEFLQLQRALRNEIPCLTIAGHERNIDSLTSKALWCCHPTQVPILDKNAEFALGLLGRVMSIPAVPVQSRYGSFVDQWFAIYDRVEPILTLDRPDDYRYKVRIFDRMLWWLGQAPVYGAEI